jgi:hypothetical protein
MLPEIARLVRRHPLPAFFILILAYALSWWGWPLYAAGLSPVPIASFGPFLARPGPWAASADAIRRVVEAAQSGARVAPAAATLPEGA